jgi:hypothetical protein
LTSCALDATQRSEGPAEIRLAPHTRLRLAQSLIFLPPAQGVKLMHLLGERPGAEVLGVVVSHADTPHPRVLILFASERDARGVPRIAPVGWDEAPAARSFIEELLLAQRNGDRALFP